MVAIDVSASMDAQDYAPSRLEAARRACCRFVDRLVASEPGTRLGIVTFAMFATILNHPEPVGQNRARLRALIAGVKSGPCTNIGDALGLCHTYIQLLGCAGNGRILLLTDGEANRGPDPLLVSETVKIEGTQLDIVGIGGSPKAVDEPKLRRMASVVGGELRYWFIDSASGLSEKFETLALREIR